MNDNSFDINMYYNVGQPLYKYLFRGALNHVLPERNVHVEMTSSGRICFTVPKGHIHELIVVD